MNWRRVFSTTLLHLWIALMPAFAQVDEPAPAVQPSETPSRKTERIDIERFGTLFLDAQNNLQAADILARWREYTIQAQGVQGNLDKGEYLFKGGVLLEGGGVDAKGEMLRLDVRRQR